MFNLIIFPISPVIATVLLSFFYGYSFFVPFLTVALMLLFVGLMNETIIIDYLTRVYNRSHLEDYLYRKTKSLHAVFGGIMIDLDYFKKINDSYGHLQGDNALGDLAKILTSSVHSDDFVARYGGDEFIIIVNSPDETVLKNRVELIYENIRKFNQESKYVFDLEVSIGAAMYQGKERLPIELYLNKLDHLMYTSKNNKR